MHPNFPAIVCTELTLWGSPRVDGRRLAVGDVVSIVKDYGALSEVLADYELSISEVSQALQYCSSLRCKIDQPLVFCHNCSLRRQQEGPLDTSELEEITATDSVFVKGEDFIALCSMEELLDDWSGYDWWAIATELLVDLRTELFGGNCHN